MLDVATQLGGLFASRATKDGSPSRFNSPEPKDLITGMPKLAARGIEEYLCADLDDLQRGQMSDVRLNAVLDEVNAHGSEEDKECLHYVLFEEAGSSALTFQSGLKRDCDAEGNVLSERRIKLDDGSGYRGMRLNDFVLHEDAQAAGLTDVEVACLRYYTTRAFQIINNELRNTARHEARKPHPLPLTVIHINKGLKKLRAIEADGERSTKELHLYRGMKGLKVPSSFLAKGGTELAPMSTTTSLKVAMTYSASAEGALLMRILSKNFQARGSNIAFLSAFPGEAEFLFPPLTFLQPKGKPRTLQVSGVTFTVIDIEPTLP